MRRRTFISLSAGAAASLAHGWRAPADEGAGQPAFPLGVCTGIGNADLLKACGCAFVEDGVRSILVPEKPDAEFDKCRARVEAASVPVRVCNGFLPGDMRLVGADPKHDAAVEWAGKAARRAKLLKIGIIVIGSGAARKVPDGYDAARARDQFVSVCRRMAEAVQPHEVVLAIEPLNRDETNLLNTLAQVVEVVDAVGHPNLQATADIYHMLRADEGAEALVKAGARVRHCHIAEKEGRRFPGAGGQDFRPFMKALREIGYRGGVSFECRWESLKDDLPVAVAHMKTQLG